ncbi:hypothetical protein [Flammeovirga sp. SJP92]|uniref:hypothetical protein n=1 Tax=Flammeovirga sp. SJP92 TaxID=1775430 RepID=UPI0007879B9E|nr:hypothetical protein [Flammeovirga sp. SJP92]KXX69480.1 hypothetical protein AVL50_32560 [Flammeovirga sp. SJP92]
MTKNKNVTFKKILESELINSLKNDETFEKFNHPKTQCKLSLKDKEKKIEITFSFLKTVSEDREDVIAHELYYTISLRFKIVHKWFNKFYQGSNSKDYLNASTYFKQFPGRRYEGEHFYEDSYNLSLKRSTSEIISNYNEFINNYGSLELLYQNLVEPILLGEEVNQIYTGPWIFEYLMICRITNAENYSKLKEILYSFLTEMYNDGEPNSLDYFDLFDEITNALENINIADLKK